MRKGFLSEYICGENFENGAENGEGIRKEKVRCGIKEKGSVEKSGRIAERKDRNLKEEFQEVTKTETAEEAIYAGRIEDGKWSGKIQ
jgi:hypothetical protein